MSPDTKPSDGIDSKPSEGHHELMNVVSYTGKENVAQEGDYSGAVKKTDPEEIALVRKLDFRIMPILWAMYFLNYVGLPICLLQLFFI